jgi:plasmid stabilization system protein ParE
MPQFASNSIGLLPTRRRLPSDWYRKHNETAAARFKRELDRAVDLIVSGPKSGLLT